MCSMLVPARGFRNEIYSCQCSALVSCCFGSCIKERGISLIDQGRFKS